MKTPFRPHPASFQKHNPGLGEAQQRGATGGAADHHRPSALSGRRRRAVALASVRRPNCTYSFPVCSFHEDSDMPRCKRRHQPDQVHKPILTVQRRDGKLLPPTITPTLKSMRPDPPHDPAVEWVEEHSDLGSFVILAPSPQERI